MSRQWGDQLRTGRESLRQAQRSDVRPRSVDRRVLRSEDQLFTYDDSDLTPVGDRVLVAPIQTSSIEYTDTYWTDLRIPFTQTRQGANTKPDFDTTNVGFLFPQNDTSEILYFIAQMPHSWKFETTIYPHIHWQ